MRLGEPGGSRSAGLATMDDLDEFVPAIPETTKDVSEDAQPAATSAGLLGRCRSAKTDRLVARWLVASSVCKLRKDNPPRPRKGGVAALAGQSKATERRPERPPLR
jgi:hypothetical protein